MAEKAGAARTSTQARSTTEAAGNGGETAPANGGQGRTATVNLPFVTATFRRPNVHLPRRENVNSAVRQAGNLLPSPKAALYYGGLVATAAAGLIEWPVAAAIGVGTALASRGEARPEPANQPTSSTSSTSPT
jgi:hypothetical protein